MAFTKDTVGRVRPGGNDANGAFFDATQAGALSTTLNGAIAAGDTTIVVASATGWPASGNYYAQIGAIGAESLGGSSEIVLVTGGQGTTSWTVTRAQLGTTAKAFASGIAVNNELTRCDTAIGSGSVGTSTNSTTFVDATFNAFNETHVGLYIRIASGAGATVGYYRVVTLISSTTVVLDRVSGTYTAGVWKIGGAAATHQRLLNSANATGDKVVPGNIVYIRGAGSQRPASNDYTFTGGISSVSGDYSSGGLVKVLGENGRPRLQGDGYMMQLTFVLLDHLYLTTSSTTSVRIIELYDSTIRDCICDGNDKNITFIKSGTRGKIENCEIFSKASAPTANAGADGVWVATSQTGQTSIVGCEIHHMGNSGISDQAGNNSSTTILNNLIYANKARGINFSGYNLQNVVIRGNVIDENGSDAINLLNILGPMTCTIQDNVISNHTVVAKKGLIVGGTLADNDKSNASIGFNAYYNNTANYGGISAGANDVALSADPYVSQSTRNYERNTTAGGGAALKEVGFPGLYPLGLTTDHIDIGVQRAEPAGGSGGVVAPTVVLGTDMTFVG